MYQSIQCVSNYCATHKDSCEDCVIANLCDCMSKAPCNWGLDQVREIQNIKEENIEVLDLREEVLELKAKLHNANFVADEYKDKYERLDKARNELIKEITKLTDAFDAACVFISKHNKVHDGVSSHQVAQMFLKTSNTLAEDFVIDD